MQGFIGFATHQSTAVQTHTSSALQDLKELVEALGHSKFILVGHDWGAVASWRFAACHEVSTMNRARPRLAQSGRVPLAGRSPPAGAALLPRATRCGLRCRLASQRAAWNNGSRRRCQRPLQGHQVAPLMC